MENSWLQLSPDITEVQCKGLPKNSTPASAEVPYLSGRGTALLWEMNSPSFLLHTPLLLLIGTRRGCEHLCPAPGQPGGRSLFAWL